MRRSARAISNGRMPDDVKMMTPNVPEKFTIDLWETAITFEPGHKIAVHVASTGSTKYEINPNTGELFGQKPTMTPRTATNTIFFDKDHPSAIKMLPVNLPRQRRLASGLPSDDRRQVNMMRQALSVTLALAIMLPVAAAAPDIATVTTQIHAMPLGTQMELQLKSKERVRGYRGAASDTGFALLDKHARERQIAFGERRLSATSETSPSHLRRNILIGVGIAVGTAVVIGVAYLVALGKLGRST